jgi:hypothetical protein
MTLVLTMIGPNSIWTVADRRLTDRRRTLRDDARKIMFLETRDGVAILAYAGLGATATGVEPADWMSAVLRGRNWLLEPALAAVADALKREFPRHLVQLQGQMLPSHHVVVSAFLEERQSLYTIDLAVNSTTHTQHFRHTRWIVERAGRPSTTPRFGLAGSGAYILASNQGWQRQLLRLLKAHDRGLISAMTVAGELAAINFRVSTKSADGTVGPDCIVAWRFRKNGVHKGGGAHQNFRGIEKDSDTTMLPTIANGMDVAALIDIVSPHMIAQTQRMLTGENAQELNSDSINAALANLPEGPDESLR